LAEVQGGGILTSSSTNARLNSTIVAGNSA
jgi:hypothetical protein